VTEPQKSPPKIEFRVAEGIVLIDGLRVWGFVAPELTDCGHPRIYAERWDAFFCPVDDRWLETSCGDPLCPYCPGGPDRPLQGPLEDDQNLSSFRAAT